MALVEFKDKPSTDTPINSTNLNNNFEELAGKTINSSGSNANGSFIKYEDGTMICYNKQTFNTVISTGSGVLFVSSNLSFSNYPAAFTELPVVTLNVVRGGSSYPFYVFKTNETTLTTPPTIRIANSASVVSARDYVVDYIAIGKWK